MVRLLAMGAIVFADACPTEWFTIMHKEKYCGEVYLELTFWLDVSVMLFEQLFPPCSHGFAGRNLRRRRRQTPSQRMGSTVVVAHSFP